MFLKILILAFKDSKIIILNNHVCYVVIITSLLTEFIDIVDPFSVSSFLKEDKF